MMINIGGGEGLGKLLRALKAAVGDDDSDRLVKKAIPAKPEWVEGMKRLDDMHQQMHELDDKIQADRKKLWAQIELDMDDFSTDKRWNDETKEVEVLAEKDRDCDSGGKNKPIKSPFQKGEL